MASWKNAAQVFGAEAKTEELGGQALPQPKSNRKTRGKTPTVPSQAAAKPKLTKREQLIKLLSTKQGADLVSISAAFGWLPHTTRAALSGLRNVGHAIETEKGEGGQPTRYRILVAPVAGPTQADVPAPDAGAA